MSPHKSSTCRIVPAYFQPALLTAPDMHLACIKLTSTERQKKKGIEQRQ